MQTNNTIRRLENTHIFLWLLKDLCWVMDFTYLGTLMIVPAVGMAVYILAKTSPKTSDFYYNVAVLCWILANSAWMLGEMYFEETSLHHVYEGTKVFASVFFVIGIGFILYFHFKKYFKNRVKK